MSAQSEILKPCPDCGLDLLHHSDHSGGWDECDNGHVHHLRLTPGGPEGRWTAHDTDPKACPGTTRHDGAIVFDFKRLSEHGVLWIINRVVFHPRGFALSLVYSDDDGNVDPIGWRIEGDGSEVWRFGDVDEDAKMRALDALLDEARALGAAPTTLVVER